MRFRKLVSSSLILIVLLTLLHTGNIAFASSPQKIEKTFYQNIENSSQEEIVIIKFKNDSAVEYSKQNQDTILSTAKPSDKTFLKIDESYVRKLLDYQMEWVNVKNKEFPFNLVHTYQYVYNGIAIKIRGYNIRFLAKDPRVDRIYDTRTEYRFNRQYSTSTISANQAWNKQDSNNNNITGEGIRVGILDSGIDYYHPDFLDNNGKASRIKGGRDFADNDDDYYDSGSTGKLVYGPHGTHVAGITSGNNLANPLKKGVAPDSDLYIYKVFSNKSSKGANISDIIDAIEQSVIDKCHVINLSLGYIDPEEPQPSVDLGNPEYEAIKKAVSAGVVVVCAAGNDGSRNQRTPFTLSAPGIYEPSIQVASSDDRMNVPLIVRHPDGKKQWINCLKFKHTPPFRMDFNGIKIIDCSFGRTEDFQNVDVRGKIAFISRGPKEAAISFKEKNLNAKKAGAIAVITYNYDEEPLLGVLVTPDSTISPYDFDFIPNIQLSGANAFIVKKAFENGGQIEFPKNTNLSLSDFSSGGPCFSGDDNIFKPEISAPGSQINSAVMSSRDSQNNAIAKYEDWDGTSMATPHVTGVIALIRQAHPDWNTSDVKSVVMNTADIVQNQICDQPYSFFYQGSGQINAFSAIKAPIITSPPSLMGNIAKLDDSYTFEIKNTTNSTISVYTSFEIFGETLNNNPIQTSISDNNLTLGIGEKKKFSISISIDETKFIHKRYEGVIWVQSANAKHHIPIILYKGRLSEVDKPISNFTVSGTSIDVKNPIPLTISFQINTGSRTIVKGIKPELDSCSNLADTFKIYVTDAKKKILGTVYFAENLFVGHYSFSWKGLDIYGKEIVQSGTYYLMAEISGLKKIVEDGELSEVLSFPENSDLIPIQFNSSSTPTPPDPPSPPEEPPSPGDKPDLTATYLEYNPKVAAENQLLTIKTGIKNISTAVAGKSHTAFYLTLTEDPDKDEDFTFISEVAVNLLSAGEETLIEYSFTFPDLKNSNNSQYQAWIWCFVDSQEEVDESDEKNLWYSGPITVYDNHDQPPPPEEPPSPGPSGQIIIRLAIGSNIAAITRNGNMEYATLDLPPFTQEGRTMVPLRFIAESFGAKLQWTEDSNNSGEGQIIITLAKSNGSRIKIQMHSLQKIVITERYAPNSTYPETNRFEMEVAPFIVRPANRTVVPLRFIAEGFGSTMNWIPESQEIEIQYSP